MIRVSHAVIVIAAGLALAGHASAQSSPAAEPRPADAAPPPSDAAAPQAAPAPSAMTPGAASPMKKPLSGPATTTDPSVTQNKKDFEVGPAPTIEKKDDGSMLIDGRFPVKGEGTAEKPYEIPWEMLVSAEESFAPDKKLRTIPGRVNMLDGKHVRITGHILFPLFVQKPKELLTMLNQWDGCCIGVPPTPYDAVEVKLTRAVADDERFATQGTVEGVLGVKPFLTGDWLVGLYIIENATFTVGAASPTNAGHPTGIPPN